MPSSQETFEGIHQEMITLNAAAREAKAILDDIKETIDVIEGTGVRQFQNLVLKLERENHFYFGASEVEM